MDGCLELTRVRVLQEALNDPNQAVRVPLTLTHLIALSLHLVLFSPSALTAFNVLIILPQPLL